MKNQLFTFLAIVCMVATTTSCGTSDGTSKARKEFPYENLQNLAEVLRRQGGLEVLGTGSNVRVLIRGVSTITLGTEPLYIVDGAILGNSYAIADNAVNPDEITSIRVLRGKSETTIYGEPGNNGVIVIKTKKAQK